MSTQEILAELPSLSVEDRERIAKALRDLGMEQQEAPTSGRLPRTPNLHPGAWEMAPDFDDPLPDAFWLGEDA